MTHINMHNAHTKCTKIRCSFSLSLILTLILTLTLTLTLTLSDVPLHTADAHDQVHIPERVERTVCSEFATVILQ